ncbi:uncharacterized protein ATC70_006389 [Mucor velutinosus]|uniref:Uncharacterized protein n=1 Tax=Mucor velutinosus TaxID=708070 RepID=A0AAN7HX71_9FUNG|nr:hypothetical protein ATC70_006389 [Mucor velutinosus]
MMDNPSGNQQDSMSFKAAKMAYQLVESTERFLTTAGELDSQSINLVGNNINDHITRVIQQYENVCMIVNALQAISLCVGDPQNRTSLLTAATSASTSSSTALSRIYSQISSLQIDDNTARESLNQLALLVQQSKLVHVKLEVSSSSSNASSQPMQISPPPPPSSSSSTQNMDNERRELALKRKQFDEEKEEFERERKRLLLDKETANQRLKKQHLIEQQDQQRKQLVQQQQQQQQKQKEQQQHLQLQQQRYEQRLLELQNQKRERQKLEQEKKQKEQQDKKNLAKQKQHIHVLSTDQFLEQFEKTAETFAQSINMDIDNVWESMLIHALPKDKLPWANETIIGKKHPWRYAKQLYYIKYAEKLNNALSFPTDHPAETGSSSSIPAAPTAAFAATNAVTQATASTSSIDVVPTNGAPTITTTTTVNAPLSPLRKLLERPAPSTADPPKERDQRRIADYCQHLLSLEMKFYDTIEQYNKRYMRYCTIANVDLTGKNFIDRYIRSLDPKYRDIVRAALQLHKQPLNHIKDVMAVAEETVNAYIAASRTRSNAPYSQNCVHNRKVNQTV